MRFIKATGVQVERLKGYSDGNLIEVWQYPKTVMIEVNGTIVKVNRTKLKKFLARKP